MTRSILFAAIAPLLLFPAGCRRDGGVSTHGDDEPGHAEHGEESPAEAADARGAEIRLPLAGLRGLAFIHAGEPQEEGIWAPAEAVSDSASVAIVSAPASGLVGRLLVGPGESVAKGRAVAELVSAEVADLYSRWRTANAERRRAELEAEREMKLLEVEATSRREAEAAAAAVETARAEAEAARAALVARGVDPERFEGALVLRSPTAGTLERWEVAIGEGVESGQPLATIRAREATRVRVELAPPGHSDWLAGAETEVRRGDGRRWRAVVEGLPAGLTSDTRRYPYLLKLEAGPFPAPGTPLEVRVPLARGIVVPQEALQQIEGDWGVFVRRGDEAIFRPVRRGAELGGNVLVLEGIVPGEEVATAGAYLLRPLWMKRSGGGEEHAH
ncbi:MAG TPA: HlyD family efflux transporter periplasmic adaptor subunit [Thermoanaerobaculia bacterium]|nr:HlyD family efflux transporter periplasmic adaptor subunit [Thermoanaerobaculia bacterium]